MDDENENYEKSKIFDKFLDKERNDEMINKSVDDENVDEHVDDAKIDKSTDDAKINAGNKDENESINKIDDEENEEKFQIFTKFLDETRNDESVHGLRDNTESIKDIDDNDDNDSDDGIPYDKGWAWMVVAGSFLLFLIIPTNTYMISVLLIDFLDQFSTSVSRVTMVIFISGLAYCVAAQLATNLLPRWFSVRQSAGVASLLSSISLLLLAVAPYYFVFVICQFVRQAAAGTCLIPSISLIGVYFKKRRGLATSLALMGFSFTAILIPPLIRLLRQEFGLQGCLLVLAGYELHAVLGALLLRPVTSYKKSSNQIVSNSSEKHKSSNYKTSSSDNKTESDTDLESQRHSKSENIVMEEVKLLNVENNDNKTKTLENGSRICVNNLEPISSNLDLSKSNRSLCDLQIVSYSKYGSSSSIPLQFTNKINETERQKNKLKMDKSFKWKLLHILSFVVDITMLKNYLCVMCVLSYTFSYSFSFINTYLPTYATTSGVEETRSALLLTISGSVDMLGRLLFGYFADFNVLRPHKIMAIGCMILAIVSQFVFLFRSFQTLVFYAVVSGFFGGCGLSLNSVYVIDVLGVECLGKVLAICSLSAGLITSVEHLIIGTLVEVTGQYSSAFHYVGAVYALAALIYISEPLVRRLQERRVNKINKRQDLER